MLKLAPKLFDASDAAVIITRPDFDYPGPTVVYANPAASRLTGYSVAEMVGGSPRMLQGPATTLASRKAMARALRNRESCRVVVKNYRKTGELYDCEIEIRPVCDADGEVIYAIAFEQERPIRRGRRRSAG